MAVATGRALQRMRLDAHLDLKLIEGRLPKRVVALVLEWAFEHRRELTDNWERAVAHQPLQPIAPLE